MIYILYGSEYYLMKDKEKEIISKSKIDNIISIDFESSNLEEVLNESRFIDIFNNKKLIIVNNFSFKELSSSDEESLEKYLSFKTDNIIIFKCIDNNLDERKKIIKKLKESCEIYYAKKMDRIELNNYIVSLFKLNGFKINSDLAKKIINKCTYNNYSSDNGYILNEVNKLIIYKINDKSINETDIDLVVSKNTENEIFDFTKEVLKRNNDGIFKEFKLLKELDVDPFFILNSLAKQYRTLMQIKILNETLNNSEISKKLGINPYVVENNIGYINNYTYEELIDILHELFLMDVRMKSEVVDNYRLIEELLIKM